MAFPDQSVSDSFGVQLGLLDQLRAGFGLSFSDSISFTDAIQLLNRGALGLSDTLSFSDLLQLVNAGILSFTDAVTLTDAAQMVNGAGVTLNDLISLSDILGSGFGDTIGDNFSFLDSAQIHIDSVSNVKVPFHLYSRGLRGCL